MSSDEVSREKPASPGPDSIVPGDPQGSSHLFLLRVWLEEDPKADSDTGGRGEDKAPRWQGKVQHVVRGEAHAFAGWDMMVTCLEAMLLRDLSALAQAKAEEQTPEREANKESNGGTPWKSASIL